MVIVFCLCFFLSFFILRLSGLCTADEHSVNLPDLIYALTSYRVREHLAHVKMLVKIATFFGTTTTIFAYLLSFLFTKFALGRVCQVLTQWRFSMNPKQTNTKWSEQYQQDDWKQCMTAQGDNLEGCRFDWNSL